MMSDKLGNLMMFLLCCVELAFSTAVHLLYAFYFFCWAVAADILIQLNLISRAANPTDHSSSGQEISANPSEAVLVSGGSVVADNDDAPIVLVHGIFGFGKGKMGSLSYWGGAEKKDGRVLVPDLGSLTSIHDRARELFYYLKGGRVDYGLDHSRKCGHSQFGRTYAKGHYPEWDEEHPVHFVGHSTGALVVRVLQQMLGDKQFEDFDETNADWVLSLTSLSGVLNGSTRVYLDGIRPEDGQKLRGICLFQVLRVGVLIYEWLDIWALKKYYGFGFDHFHMTRTKVGLVGLTQALLFNDKGPFASGDWIGPDLSIQSALKVNKHLQTFPNTFYFSYATQQTCKLFGFIVPSSFMKIHPLFSLRALQMCQWKHPPHSPPPYQGYRDEDWQHNDGAVNTISMLYPRFPISHSKCYLQLGLKHGQPLQTGIWYYTILEGDHISFVINHKRAGIQFDLLYATIFQRCRKHMKRMLITKNIQALEGFGCLENQV